ncbi:MAG: lytic murein transglycosylase [Patescibacteria group bacterium]
MFNLLKPKILRDIKSPSRMGEGDSFSSLPSRINLSYYAARRIPIFNTLKVIVPVFAMAFLILGSAVAPTTSTLAANNTLDENEREALEVQLKELEGQIDQYEDQIVSYQKQGKTLKGEISNLNNKISKIGLEIKAINLTISQLDRKIGETQYQIVTTESDIEKNRESLAVLIKNLQASDQTSLMEVFLKSPRLSDFFNDVNNIILIQDNLQLTISKITDLKDQLEDQKDKLSLAKADKTTLREYQEVQKQENEKTKTQKNGLLDITKGQEGKYQSLLTETKKTAAEIRSRIFKLLGGGELSFDEAYKFAKLAGQSTGIDPAMILAVLDRESALGKNVGRCNYKTAMHPKRDIPIFEEILKELGISQDSSAALVSCANKDGAYGGAMGPAQFIPSTWKLYKDAVSKITGNSPANPWRHADAFVATGLYLKDAMRGCVDLYSNQTSRERCAAAKYYAGSRWRSYLWTYGEAVISRAIRFRDDIKTLTG